MFTPIPVEEFSDRIELTLGKVLPRAWDGVTKIVSLRDLAAGHIDAIQIMPHTYLRQLLSHVVLAGGNRSRVYEKCELRIVSISPRAVNIGQRFIERKKYQALIEGSRAVLGRFSTPGGIGSLGAFLAFGVCTDGTVAMAHYLPPIAEMNGGSAWTLLDGIHRNFIIDSIGGTTPVIAIEGVHEPFPCLLHGWDDIKPVNEKPPPSERYFDLKPDLFRDLKYVGIDG